MALRILFKETNKLTKQTHTDNELVVTKGKWVERGQKWVKGIKYKMMNGNQTSGSRHSICIQII